MLNRNVSDQNLPEQHLPDHGLSAQKRSNHKPSETKIPEATASTSAMVAFPANQLPSAELLHIAADPAVTEDLALALLKQAGLPPEALEQLARNATALRSRKVKIALVSHPKTPRHLSLPLARQFYTFDLMKVSLSSQVPTDVKIAVEGVLIGRLKTVTLGERLALARRASGRVAAALLLDSETRNDGIVKGKVGRAEPIQTRVMRIALENPRLTEALVINSVLRPAAGAALVHAVAHHPKWSIRKEVRAALLRTEHLSLARALEFGREFPIPVLREILASSRLPNQVKCHLLREREIDKALLSPARN